MAAKFVVVLALVAIANARPDVSGVREKRAYSEGQAYNYGGGLSSAQAKVYGNNAQAYGSAGGNHLGRDGLAYPGQAIAQAQTNPGFGGSKAVAQAQDGAFYSVPAPATVITYHQNFETPAEVIYEVPSAVHAQSSAVMNGNSGSSITSATSNGAGNAESSAKTQGYGYEETSSNAKTGYGGYGSANSNAKTGYGSTSSSANTQGQGSASSNAVINGSPVYTVPVGQVDGEVSVIDAKTPVFHTAYVPRVFPVAPVASSNANVVGAGSAASSAKLGGRTISWRFGTLYDAPANTYAQANTNSYGSANANADVGSGAYSSLKSAANTQGYGSAHSAATANGAGNSNANANVNSGYGAAKSAATTQYGQALSSANTNSANGNAKSSANINEGYYGGRTSADSESHGYGNAQSSARTQGLTAAYKVVNSHANSFGPGSARAHAVTNA